MASGLILKTSSSDSWRLQALIYLASSFMIHGMRLIKLHSTINYQASARNHVVLLPEVDMSHEAIYHEPAKEPIREDNDAFQSFTQPIEGVHVPNPPAHVGPLAGQLRLP